MKKILSIFSKLFFACAVLFYVFHFLFFWVFETTDSYFYWALGNFLRTGMYSAPHPYYYTVPSTMEPPLYSFFLYIAEFLPRADIFVHFVQIAGFIVSALFLYKILTNYMKKEIALIVSSLFLLVPANFIYASNLLAEGLSILFISVFIYLSYLIIEKKKTVYIGILLMFSSLMILERYNLIVYWGVAFLIFLLLPRKHLRDFFALFVSVLIIVIWIFTNHAWNGSWGLSNTSGKYLWNRIAWKNELLPSETNRDLILLKQTLGKEMDLKQPWWVLEPLLLKNMNNSETGSSKMLEKAAVAALLEHPIEFVKVIPEYFLTAHDNRMPFHDGLYSGGRYMDGNCRSLGKIDFCKPVIPWEGAKIIWDKIVGFSEYYYSNVSFWWNYILLFPAIIIGLIRKNSFIRFVIGMYFLSVLFIVLTGEPGTRYVYPFLPLKILIISAVFIPLVQPLWRRFQRFI